MLVTVGVVDCNDGVLLVFTPRSGGGAGPRPIPFSSRADAMDWLSKNGVSPTATKRLESNGTVDAEIPNDLLGVQ